MAAFVELGTRVISVCARLGIYLLKLKVSPVVEPLLVLFAERPLNKTGSAYFIPTVRGPPVMVYPLFATDTEMLPLELILLRVSSYCPAEMLVSVPLAAPVLPAETEMSVAARPAMLVLKLRVSLAVVV